MSDKVNEFHNNEVKERLEQMTTTSFLRDKKRTKYNKMGRQFINSPDTVNDVRAANIKSLFLTDEYPTAQHDNRIRGRRTDPGNCKFCERQGIVAIDTVTHALETCYLAKEDDMVDLWRGICQQAAAILEICPTFFASHYTATPGSKAAFILNPDHSSIPAIHSVAQHHSTNAFLNNLSKYTWYVHLKRLRAQKLFSDFSKVNNGKTTVGRDPQVPSTKGKSQSNKITKYLNSSSNNVQIIDNEDDVKTFSNVSERSRCNTWL